MGIKLTDLNVDGVEEVLSTVVGSGDQAKKKKAIIDMCGEQTDSSVSSWPGDDVDEEDDENY